MIIFYVLLGLMLWVFLGCVILAAVDKNGALLVWVKSAPDPVFEILAFLLWPIVVIAFKVRA